MQSSRTQLLCRKPALSFNIGASSNCWGFSELDSPLDPGVLCPILCLRCSKALFLSLQELAQLSTQFSNNIQDATKAFKKLLTDPAEIDGLPPSALGLAAQTAAANGHESATAESGPWMFTLDMPSYVPVLQHAKNRALREEMYRAYLTRASVGDVDNTPIIEKILALKKEKAQLLGFENHADVSLATKMATLERAQGLLEELRSASWDAALKVSLNPLLNRVGACYYVFPFFQTWPWLHNRTG